MPFRSLKNEVISVDFQKICGDLQFNDGHMFIPTNYLKPDTWNYSKIIEDHAVIVKDHAIQSDHYQRLYCDTPSLPMLFKCGKSV